MAYKYNPGFLSDSDSIESFVVRQRDLRIVKEVLTENSTATSNRHVLIVGPRGSGKTTLVRRLVAELKTNDELGKFWFPLVLGEESYNITSAGEFWLECVLHLAEQTARSNLHLSYHEMLAEEDDVRLRERSLSVLISFAREEHKRILLVVENLNMILEDQMVTEEGWAIRHALQNVPEIMLLATATKRFDQIQNYEKALFEQFKIHELRPLSLSDISALWLRYTQEKLRSSKARPIQILTGGSPRLITVLAEFATDHSFANLMMRLTALIDQYTDYFKSQLETLAPQERKVFVTLLEKWDPATTREVAGDARMQVNTVSALMNRLRSKGAVQRRSVDGAQYWEATERLFNIYYLMRRRGGASNRVYALVKFMTVYYDEHAQLFARTTDLAKECSALDPKHREDHYTALAELLGRFDTNSRAALLKLTPPDFVERFGNLENPATSAALQRKRPRLTPSAKKILDLLPNGDLSLAAELLQAGDFRKSDFADLWAMVGFAIGIKADRFELAETLLNQAEQLDPKSARALLFRSVLLEMNDKPQEALNKLLAARRVEPNNAEVLIALGHIYEKLSEWSEAEAAYRRATVESPDKADTWAALGTFFATRSDAYSEAESYLRKAIQLAPNDSKHIRTLAAFLLYGASKPAEAEALLRSLLKKDSSSGTLWQHLIRALSRQHKPEHVVRMAYSRAMAVKEMRGPWRVSSAFADYLDSLHEHDEAEHILRDATLSDPKSGQAWFALARHLAATKNKSEEAFEAFKRTLELRPKDSRAWASFGAFLANRMTKSAEAKEALTKATEISPYDCNSWRSLGEFFAKESDPEEAMRCFDRAIAVNPRCGCVIPGYCSALQKTGAGPREVTEFIQKFIERMPGNPAPHVALSRYLLELSEDRQGAATELLVALRKGAEADSIVDLYMELVPVANAIDSIRMIDTFREAAGESASLNNSIAWSLFTRSASKPLLDYAVALAESSVILTTSSGDDVAWMRRHTLACLLISVGRTEEGLRQIDWLATRLREALLKDFVDLCVIAARSSAKDLLNILEKSEKRGLFEPLIVALQILEHRESAVAQEVLEVARDLYKQIISDKPYGADMAQLESE